MKHGNGTVASESIFDILLREQSSSVKQRQIYLEASLNVDLTSGVHTVPSGDMRIYDEIIITTSHPLVVASLCHQKCAGYRQVSRCWLYVGGLPYRGVTPLVG